LGKLGPRGERRAGRGASPIGSHEGPARAESHTHVGWLGAGGGQGTHGGEYSVLTKRPGLKYRCVQEGGATERARAT
jgi:hypothetical protein